MGFRCIIFAVLNNNNCNDFDPVSSHAGSSLLAEAEFAHAERFLVSINLIINQSNFGKNIPSSYA